MIPLHTTLGTIAQSAISLMTRNAVLLGLLLVVIAIARRLLGGGPVGRCLQIECKRLMTATEVRFWHRLEAALPDHRVFGQLSMGALLKPARGLSRSDWWSSFGRFSQKIVDFVVVEAATGDVVAIVELDDPSHNRSADAARDAMLGRGGYLVLRFDVRRFPSVTDIRSRFALGANGRVARPRLEVRQ